MLHKLKIRQCYLTHVIEGLKKFEVRKNDRDFQVGDEIQFLPLEDENYNIYSMSPVILKYRIDYVLSDFAGLQPGFVCMSISPISDEA